jgi:hypothetical protein
MADTSEIGIEVIDGREALGIIVFRDAGDDQIGTEIKGMKLSKLDLAKLCMQLGRALKTQHDAEQGSGGSES